ncbi:beta-1,4-galactosyltransferase [Oceanobacillus arenosus]|uniref:Beta-1,4-galactosyltransferase n=1 Tax=Oceanobacillus arenosus TaxID=1229153 RepID=A0A3D8Q3I2_9BACI|nr:glycosyltransferase [Oceanobacillus arenosus]RDW22401.1 beta-1,4-galactosyltransferase [Oceanobacillus arenosus]
MPEKGKVSVIVPIYKVEKYIHRCVDSIINQTYVNLEIILVDDGSPDNCGEIVDDYQESDTRIKVIHKKNGGLSDARNHGMKQATGEFIMFVDSDDWLDKTMIELLVSNSIENKADIVQSAFYYAYEDRLLIDNRYSTEGDSLEILTNKSLMYELVTNKKVKNFAWGKLYRTELISDIPFEKGVLFEDIFWAYQVMQRVNTFLLLQQPFYYYYQRSDSIVATYTPRNLDIIRGLKERHLFIEKQYEELTDASFKEILKMCLIHYNLLLLNRKKDKGGTHRKKIHSYIRDNNSNLKRAVQDERELQRQLFLFSFHPYLNVLYLGLRKGLRKIKLLSKPEGLKQVDV